MMRGIRSQLPVHVEDRLPAPLRPPALRTPDTFFHWLARWTLGLVQGERWRLRMGPLTLLDFGPPCEQSEGWTWPIRDGLLARHGGGSLRIEWRDGELVATVDGYAPRLPHLLYRALQLPVHHFLTRLFLLHLRGRVPPPGVPAGPAQRLVAAWLDLGICATATLLVARRRRSATFAGLAIAYHVAAWTTTGKTLGGAALGLRLVSVDGGRVSPVQAAARLALLPVALARFRAVHDEVAATEVVEATRSGPQHELAGGAT